MAIKNTVICGSVSAAAAIDQLAVLTGSTGMRLESVQYYPYFSFRGNCSVPSLFGRKPAELYCLVDGIAGHGATADRFETESVLLADEEFLAPKITATDARRIALRTLTHAIGRNLRVIAQTDLRLAAAETTYKKFWVVGDANLRAIVDSTNGGMHPLRSRAA